jgi:hypothetical protein
LWYIAPENDYGMGSSDPSKFFSPENSGIFPWLFLRREVEVWHEDLRRDMA